MAKDKVRFMEVVGGDLSEHGLLLWLVHMKVRKE